MSRHRLGSLAVEDLDAPDLAPLAGRIDGNGVSLPDDSRGQGAGHHGPESPLGEDPVHRQPDHSFLPVTTVPIRSSRLLEQRLFQSVQSAARDAVHGDDGTVLEEASPGHRSNLFPNQVQKFRFHRITLGEDDDSSRNAQQPADMKVLPCLRHDRFVGGDDEQRQVDAADAGQHVLDQPFVPRDIDEPNAAGTQGHVGKADVDGDPAALFLLQAIGVDPRQGFQEGGLAVIDVTGGSDQKVSHPRRL